ncbi:MAG TPA: hypothetical protein VF240_02190 [Pyrinomonadaceae bacterium]
MNFQSRSLRPRRRWRPLPLLLLAALASVATFSLPTSHAGNAPAQTQGRSPLDPLTPQERERAASIAEGDTRTLALRGTGRQHRVSVELADVKPPEPTPTLTDPDRAPRPGRYAEVLYYRYATNDGLRVIVNLDSGRVQDAARVDSREVPFAFEELEEASALALQNPQLRGLLGPSADRYRVLSSAPGEDRDALRVEGLRILASSPRDPCWQHRCVSLLFRQGRRYLTYTDVTVDLTTRRVRVERKNPR